jgi:flagellar hook-associated protein 2
MATTTPAGTISGLSSNIQWGDLIDQIMTQEQARTLDPVTAKITSDKTSLSTWGTFQSLVSALQTNAKSLGSTAFDAMQSYVGSGQTNKTLLTMTATSAAATGTYRTEILSIARPDKIGGKVISSATSALGLSGDFYVNGARVSVASTDTLTSIRDAINAAAGGTSGTAVSASVLSIGGTSNRLVLTAANPGAESIQVADGASGVLAALGVVDGTSAVNGTGDGGSQSFRFRTANTAIGTLLGGTMPASAAITVGNTTVNINLATQSLNDIRDAIVAAGVSASVDSATSGSTTSSKLSVGAPVSAVTGDAVSSRIVSLLGFSVPGRGAVAQVVADTSAFTDAASTPATSATLLSDLKVAGASAGLAAGDTITINGKRGDGTVVSGSITLAGGETLQDLLTKLNSGTMFGAGRTATASISGGTLQLTDSLGGDSQLSMSLVVNKAGGGTASLGQMGAQTVGYSRELIAGSDAQVRIDGTLITRPSNTITDAISGVTLNLIDAEPGTTMDVPVARDTSSALSAMQSLVSSYNSVASFVTSQTQPGAALAFNSTLRGTISALKQTIINAVPGLSGTYTQTAVAGLTFDKTGTLQLDATAFKTALSANPDAVKALFATTVSASTGLSYVSDTTKTQSGTFAVNVTAPATHATFTGTGFSGTYADSGTPDVITITDGDTFGTGSVSLATGDDIDAIVGKFNTLFSTQGMNLTASKSGGQLVIQGKGYGSAAKFNMAIDAGGSNPTSQLGIATAQITGTDIVGTIGGVAAVGSGQNLVGAAGSTSDGLTVQYTGSALYTGSVVHTLGAASLLSSLTDSLSRSGDGVIDSQKTSLQARIDSNTTRTTDLQHRLDLHRAALVAQYTKMESALSLLNAQASTLTSQIKSLQVQGN